MTKKVAGFLGLLGTIAVLSACQKKDATYSDIPEITYQGMNMTHINALTDSGDWYMYYDFVDGNGDLGTKIDDTEMRVFLTNVITGAEYRFPFPYIGQQERSGKKYLKGYGNIRLNIPTFFPLAPGVANDTAVFSLSIKDEAGNVSNLIHTDTIYIYR
ncbi:MAG: hypothetical protein BGO31_07145 [Bacteroidetes bacterium 43-16]|nr:MAG: hypothetical protein BGO31_07145 [Bacteroidetes bacterium 43-16]